MILDIIIPIFNREKQITNIVNKLNDEFKDIKYNFIFVDDCSNDKTLTILKNLYNQDEDNIKIISLSRNHGKDLAVFAGLNASKHDLICIYDIDSQVSTSNIRKMYNYLLDHNDCDQVCMYSNYEEKSFFTKNNIKFFNKIYNLKVNNNITYTRIMKKSVKDAILQMSKHYNYSKYLFEMIGFNTYYVKYDSKEVDKYYLKALLQYSENPFRPFKILSFVTIIIALIYLLLCLLKIISINSSILLFVILLLFAFESYTKNVINRSLYKKCRTYYTIREKIGFDEDFL